MKLNHPAVVYSIPGDRCVAELASQPHKVTAIPVEKAAQLTAPVVYMRAGYELHLASEALIKAIDVEKGLRSRGARIVNPTMRNAMAQRKDMYYPILSGAGLRVPYYIPNPTWIEIRAAVATGNLSFPIVYRLSNFSGARGMFLVNNQEQYEKAKAEFGTKRTVAARYIRCVQNGRYYRLRAYVIGDRIDMTSTTVADNWNIRGEGANFHESFPTDWTPRILQIGRMLGIEIYSVDLLRDDREPKECVIVDVNPTYFYLSKPIKCPSSIQAHRKGHLDRLAAYLYSLVGRRG